MNALLGRASAVRAAVVLGVTAWLALIGPVQAKPGPSAAFTREYQAGIDAFRLGKYAAARRHLGAARDREPTLPGPYRFLAAVAAAEKDWDACITAARAAIEANPASREIAATRKLHDDCRAQLGRPGFAGELGAGGAIHVAANVAGAIVTIAGLRYGATPLAPRPIAAGVIEVVVKKAGWREGRATAKILPGIVTDVQVTLVESRR